MSARLPRDGGSPDRAPIDPATVVERLKRPGLPSGHGGLRGRRVCQSVSN